jgi:hypothetical protein
MSSSETAQGVVRRATYAVTWTLAELEAPISRYAEVIAWQPRDERAAGSRSRVHCYRGANAVGVYTQIPADDLSTAIELSRAGIFGRLEHAGLRPPRSAMMFGALYAVIL